MLPAETLRNLFNDKPYNQTVVILEYKNAYTGVLFEEVNEAYTTQICSCCGEISDNSPKGRADLRIREWICSDCGTVNDRDRKAAKNILALGHERLAVGIPVL
jgi:transposase